MSLTLVISVIAYLSRTTTLPLRMMNFLPASLDSDDFTAEICAVVRLLLLILVWAILGLEYLIRAETAVSVVVLVCAAQDCLNHPLKNIKAKARTTVIRLIASSGFRKYQGNLYL